MCLLVANNRNYEATDILPGQQIPDYICQEAEREYAGTDESQRKYIQHERLENAMHNKMQCQGALEQSIGPSGAVIMSTIVCNS